MKKSSYILTISWFFLLRPKIIIFNNDNKINGYIKLLFFISKPLKLIKRKNNEMFFQFYIDIICFDMIIKFQAKNKIVGFFDTPIGYVNFVGRKRMGSK